ncbi:hypothetical protein L9F63_026095, partial [Diploptera punctata]
VYPILNMFPHNTSSRWTRTCQNHYLLPLPYVTHFFFFFLFVIFTHSQGIQTARGGR